MERAWACSPSPCVMLLEGAMHHAVAAQITPGVSRATFDSLTERSQCDRELIQRLSRQQGERERLAPEVLLDDPLKRTYNKL